MRKLATSMKNVDEPRFSMNALIRMREVEVELLKEHKESSHPDLPLMMKMLAGVKLENTLCDGLAVTLTTQLWRWKVMLDQVSSQGLFWLKTM